MSEHKTKIELACGCGIRCCILIIPAFVAGGFFVAQRHADLVENTARSELLVQARAIARTIRPELVEKFHFTADDASLPEFKFIRQCMSEYLGLTGCRGIWTLARRADGTLVFGPESYADDDPQASPPGTVYEQPTEALINVFNSGQGLTEGPCADEYGVFVSAYATVLDPRNGNVLMVVGLDVEADAWNDMLVKARLDTVPYTVILGVLSLIGFIVVWRNRNSGRSGSFWRLYAESGVVAVLGLSLTVVLALAVNHMEKHEHINAFITLARSEAKVGMDSFHDLQYHIIDAMSGLFMASEQVDIDEFATYTESLLSKMNVRGLAWVQPVASDDRLEYEAQAAADDSIDFKIWQRGTDGEREMASERAVFYPVRFIEPQNEYNHLRGFDLGSDMACLEALNRIAATGLSSASATIAASPNSEDSNAILVFQPVHVGDSASPDGNVIIVAEIDIESFINFAVFAGYRGGARSVALKLFRINADRSYKRVAALGVANGTDFGSATVLSWEGLMHPRLVDMKQVFPVFAFGHTFVLQVSPGSAFLGNHQLLAGRIVAVGGTMFTGLLTMFVTFVLRGRAVLEELVDARTSELRHETTRLSLLLDTLGDGVIALQLPDNHVTYINHAFTEMVGYTSEEMVGGKIGILGLADGFFTGYEQGLSGQDGECLQSDVKMRHKDGHDVWTEAHTTAMVDDSHGNAGVIAVVRDISRRKQAEAEREKLQLQLGHAQKMEMVGRLAGGVAHDFNNMLQAIMGNAELALAQVAIDSPLHADINEIKNIAQRSAAVTRQLLAFARRQAVVPQVVELNQTIKDMLKMVERLIGEDIDLVWNPGHDLWRIKIDPGQVDQILVNLCVNARDAIHDCGKVSITTANVVIEPSDCVGCPNRLPGEYVMITVRDSGRGMDSETMAHAFEPFFTTKDASKGSGLGLATVYGIVAQNNGFIDADSTPGKGTRVNVCLPRYVGASECDVSMLEPDSLPEKGGGETILLVEDEKMILEIAKRILGKQGYTVLTATSPQNAIDLAQRHKGEIHLLVTDVVMPEMNGREMLERLHAFSPKMKVLFMSGYTADVVSHCGVIGDDKHFIQKPFSIQSLAVKVRDVLA